MAWVGYSPFLPRPGYLYFSSPANESTIIRRCVLPTAPDSSDGIVS